MLYFETRAGHAIETRLMLYDDILALEKTNWFGNGFYMHEGAKGLPGLFRIYFELGPLLLFFIIFICSIVMIVKNIREKSQIYNI